MKRRGDWVLLVIALLKLAKATALVVLGIIGLRVSPERLVTGIEQLFAVVSPGHHLVEEALSKLSALAPNTERHLAYASLAYAAVFLIEGTGLLLRRPWAEWMTVVVTGSFVPIELYEVMAHLGVAKLITLLLNIAIVAYLIRHRLRARSATKSAPETSRSTSPLRRDRRPN